MISKFLVEYDNYPEDLTCEEVSIILHCSKSNISRNIRNNSLPFGYYKVGRKLVFPKEELKNYLLKCKKN